MRVEFGLSGWILSCVSFLKQAPVSDGFAFDPFSFQRDGLTALEEDVGGCQIADALVIALMVVVGDEGSDCASSRRADSSSPAGCGS